MMAQHVVARLIRYMHDLDSTVLRAQGSISPEACDKPVSKPCSQWSMMVILSLLPRQYPLSRLSLTNALSQLRWPCLPGPRACQSTQSIVATPGGLYLVWEVFDDSAPGSCFWYSKMVIWTILFACIFIVDHGLLHGIMHLLGNVRAMEMKISYTRWLKTWWQGHNTVTFWPQRITKELHKS